jgi:hypothetical protein
LRHQPADHRAKNAHGGNKSRAVAAQFLGQNLGDEGDAPAQFASQPESGNETPDRIGQDGRLNETIGDVGKGVEQDGTKKQGHAAHTIAQNAEENSAHEHAEHLQVQQENAVVYQRFAGEAHAFQAGNAQDGEQNQIIDIHEIAQRADNDDGLQDLSQDRPVVFHLKRGI